MSNYHDLKCHTLAAEFLADYSGIGKRDRASLVNSLANEIQGAIEGWLQDAEAQGEIKERLANNAAEGSHPTDGGPFGTHWGPSHRGRKEA